MSGLHDASRPDLYRRVTDTIIADLQKGVRPWTKPWSAGAPGGAVGRPLRATGEPYSGVNVLLLWSEALAHGYCVQTWITFRQALKIGGHVRRGERGATVVYTDRITRTECGDDGEDVARQIPFLKAYTVFNAEQVEGLPGHFYAVPEPRDDSGRRIERAETFFAATGADIRHGGDAAFYAPGPDFLRMPSFECFADPNAYYATLAHESVHWTGHTSRLARDFGRERWGDSGYAREELVAELGAAFLCADLGLELADRSDHASYIASWLKVLNEDRRFIFSAAAHAQRACDHLHRLQPESGLKRENVPSQTAA